MGRRKDLSGQQFGKLLVLERSDRYATRGKRRVQLWKCQCECGEITYKATDKLTNSAISMCKECASQYAIRKARQKAGFTDGTQLTKIKDRAAVSENSSGIRGVYFNSKTGQYRARIKFQGKTYNLGTYKNLEEAVLARKQGELKYFESYLQSME